MPVLRYTDVFVPGGFPLYTYNPRSGLQLEERLGEVKHNLCKLVTITGHTKSGKTVLARTVLPAEDAIWVDGGSIAGEDDLWSLILEYLDIGQETSNESRAEETSKSGGKIGGGIGLFGSGAKAEANSEAGRTRGEVTRQLRTVSARIAALTGLRRTPRPLVIDDFHYLSRELQGSIVRALKPLIFDGLPVVIIAIPHRRYDAMKVEREMTGRIESIEIPAWTLVELEFIPEKGFGLLNRLLRSSETKRLADEAIGSPHLMQDFCRGICKRLGLVETSATRREVVVNEDTRDVVLRDVAASIGRPIFEKLARGPRQRSDRLQRELKGGEQVDIYELILRALAHLRPGLVSLEYEDLRSAIRQVSASQIPQIHEVARVLKHMATIAASDQSSTPVIDFEEDEKKLHVTDPFFAFFLRWGDLHR